MAEKPPPKAVHLLITSIHLEASSTDSNKRHRVQRVTRQVLAAGGDGRESGRRTLRHGSRLMDMIKSGLQGRTRTSRRWLDVWRKQIVEGPPPLSYDGRTLPSLRTVTTFPEARGFVESSFLKGLDPMSSFHAMAGREGLIGYCYKRLRLGISRGSLSRHWRTARCLRSLCAKCRRDPSYSSFSARTVWMV
jgi:hypothetical protein